MGERVAVAAAQDLALLRQARALDSALAASKFHAIAWYGQRRTGHIVLQDHGDDVWIRSVKLRELKGR